MEYHLWCEYKESVESSRPSLTLTFDHAEAHVCQSGCESSAVDAGALEQYIVRPDVAMRHAEGVQMSQALG